METHRPQPSTLTRDHKNSNNDPSDHFGDANNLIKIGKEACRDAEREMPCPVCGAPMPDLKGGKASICPVCGFKDSCCY